MDVFSGECAPSGSVPKPTETTPLPAVDSAGWLIHSDSSLGYTCHYPADAVIVTTNEPLKSITISATDAVAENCRKSRSATPQTARNTACRKSASYTSA